MNKSLLKKIALIFLIIANIIAISFTIVSIIHSTDKVINKQQLLNQY